MALFETITIGSGTVDGAVVGNCFDTTTVSTLTSGATVTYTAAQVINGVIKDTVSAGCAATLPTPKTIVTAIPNCKVGTSFEVTILNSSAGANTITVTANGSSTIVGTATIAQNNCKTFKAVVTNVTSGSEAVVFYSYGTIVF
jgi:hypothetical protein